MAQCMEAWFLADRQAVAGVYGDGFRTTALPAGDRPEEIAKGRPHSALANASRGAQKGRYDKGPDSFALLGRLDPSLVRNACPHVERLLRTLEEKCA